MENSFTKNGYWTGQLKVFDLMAYDKYTLKSIIEESINKEKVILKSADKRYRKKSKAN